MNNSYEYVAVSLAKISAEEEQIKLGIVNEWRFLLSLIFWMWKLILWVGLARNLQYYYTATVFLWEMYCSLFCRVSNVTLDVHQSHDKKLY
jgi:hypothetical protein